MTKLNTSAVWSGIALKIQRKNKFSSSGFFIVVFNHIIERKLVNVLKNVTGYGILRKQNMNILEIYVFLLQPGNTWNIIVM